MKYRLALFDVDSTLIEQEVIDLLAAKTPYGQKVEQITARAMRGELDFNQALNERVQLLEGLPESVFESVLPEISFSPGAEEFVYKFREHGGVVGAVSGGFHNVLDLLLSNLNLDFLRANTLEVIDGVLTGRTVGPIIDRAAKAAALQEFAQMQRVDLNKTIAVGDGSNDLAMVELAGLGVSYRGKPILVEAADLVIDEPNLMQLLPIAISE